MIKQVGEIIKTLENFQQSVEVRGAINAALKLRGALSQVDIPVKEIEVVIKKDPFKEDLVD